MPRSAGSTRAPPSTAPGSSESTPHPHCRLVRQLEHVCALSANVHARYIRGHLSQTFERVAGSVLPRLRVFFGEMRNYIIKPSHNEQNLGVFEDKTVTARQIYPLFYKTC